MLVVASALLVAAGCGSDESSSSSSGEGDATKVVAAFYPLAWAAEQVDGEGIEVENLTPPGVEPHDLELTPRDVAKIEQADVILYVGHGFQPAVEDAIERSDAEKIDVLDIEGLQLLEATEDDGHGHGDEGEDGHADDGDEAHADEGADEHSDEEGKDNAAGQEGGHADEGEDEHAEEGDDHADEQLASDPHVWLDPTRQAMIAEKVAEVLDADATDLVERLNGLDEDFKSGLAACERREMFTSHAAFGYLADRYDLEQVAISGLSPDAEPLAKDMKRIAEQAEEAGATTIFFETLVSPKLSEQVANEIGAKTAVLDPIEGIAEDRLEDGDDYLVVMAENLAALRAGLDCT
jgi:zinc transport system substrate-binding protein